MKRILLLVMLALTICSSCFANEQDIVNSFKSFVETEFKPIKDSYPVLGNDKIEFHKGDKYRKAYYQKNNQNFSCEILDVKSTDSLILPYIGSVLLEQATNYYKRSPYIEQAMGEIDIEFIITEKYKFEYGYQSGQWNLIGVTAYDDEGLSKRYKATNSDKAKLYKPFYKDN